MTYDSQLDFSMGIIMYVRVCREKMNKLLPVKSYHHIQFKRGFPFDLKNNKIKR